LLKVFERWTAEIESPFAMDQAEGTISNKEGQ